MVLVHLRMCVLWKYILNLSYVVCRMLDKPLSLYAYCHSLYRFWGMLGYLANTLIFIIVGVVIAQRAFDGVQNIDWMFMFALYIGVMVIR